MLVEGHTIQRHLQHSHRTPPADSSRIFAHLAFQGKIKAAMRFLTEQSRGSFLPLSTPVGESTVFYELVKKHPDPSPATLLSLINPCTTNLQSCHLSSLTVWTVVLFVVLLFALRDLLDLQELMLWGRGVYVLLSGLLSQISVIPWP